MAVTVTNSATADGTLTTVATVPLTGLPTGGQSRLMSGAEITAFPVAVGFRPAIQRQSGLGFICTLGGFGGTGIIDGNSIWPRFAQRTARLLADGQVVEVQLLAQSTGSVEVFVNGVKPDVAPARSVLTGICYLHIDLGAAVAGTLVEIRTDCYIGQVATSAGHTVSQPSANSGKRVLVIGESVTQPIVWDSATGLAAMPGYGHWQRKFRRLTGVAEVQVEGVGGTSFFTRQAGAFGSGINNYLDRVTGHITYAPDVLIVATAWSDDYAAGATQAQSVGNADLYVQAIRAALPSCVIVLAEGLRAPSFADPTSTYVAWTEAMRALHSDLDWIRPSGWIGLGGYTPGHKTGTGNSDTFIGSDALHPTIEGHDHYLNLYAPIVKDILADSGGALVNTILTAPPEGVSMTVSAKVYGQFAAKLANKEVDYDSDTIKVMLCTSAYTPDQDAHVYKSSVTNEITGTGYTAGGVTLASKTVTYTGASNTVTLSAANASWGPSSTLTARYAVIYESTGTDATSALIAYVDFGADVSSTSSTFQITWDAVNGIVTFTAA